MITSQDFHKVQYQNPGPALNDNRPALRNIIGLDSEALTTGAPFMFCTSHGDVFRPDQIPHCLFGVKYLNANFVLYNMRYDGGALLYHLPEANLRELWQTGSTTYEYMRNVEVDHGQPGEVVRFRYKYIPHKLLRIYKGRKCISFWDIAQFYHASLDKASKRYLEEGKMDIRTKRFKPEYVERYWKSIAKYCIQDASLTARLGEYFVNKLMEFGITPATIYSSASISCKYFCNNARVVTAWRYWNENRDVLKFACDAYEGGKFEVTQRGRFTGYEYDITSAYPYEIANLVDISRAESVRTRDYQKDAVYGFLRVKIDNPDGVPLPCGVKINNVRIYPAGTYYLTITKNEYDYLAYLSTITNVRVEVHDAIWLFVSRKRYPYRNVIDDLFEIKADYKGKDPMLYDVAKVAMNGFYGKCVQAIDLPGGKILAGAGWNPVYGAVITANTRLKVTDAQQRLGSHCLAVHTDSVITDREIPLETFPKGPVRKLYGKGALGNFEYVDQGDSIIVACGMYQLGSACAFKGFRPKRGDTWEAILTRYKHRQKLRYRIRHVESWVEAMAKNHGKSTVNVFMNSQKEIDLNCDVKRGWFQKVKGRDLLSRLHDSSPKIHVELEPPEYWT